MITIASAWELPYNWDSVKEDKFVCGIECEIEAVKEPIPVINFEVKQDGSLRNKHAPGGHGHEYVSVPLSREATVEAFKDLHSKLTFFKGEEPFGPRTSTHVHVNGLNLSLAQGRELLLLYALFEEFFFAVVKPERRGNIHCVPLTETNMPHHYYQDLGRLSRHWHKYTAINLSPLTSLGSIEFRHLHGTNDAEQLNTWLQVLENLWHLAKTETVNAETLMDKVKIMSWFENIFHVVPDVFRFRSSLFDIIGNNLIDVKFSTINRD